MTAGATPRSALTGPTHCCNQIAVVRLDEDDNWVTLVRR
jgi:hypothetical protein